MRTVAKRCCTLTDRLQRVLQLSGDKMETIFCVGAAAPGEVMKRTQDKQKNAFFVRIYDDETLQSIYELFGTKQFDSMNDLLNRAVRAGIEQIYLDYGKRRVLPFTGEPTEQPNVRLEAIEKKLKEMSLSLDDVLVLMSMVEMLTSTLYNVETARVKGEPVDAELIESGYFSTLPEQLQGIKDKLIERMQKKKRS